MCSSWMQRNFRRTLETENTNKISMERNGVLMAEIITLLVLLAIIYIPQMITNAKLENYDMSKVDNVKLTKDMQNGVSVDDRRRRCVNGYYDKK